MGKSDKGILVVDDNAGIRSALKILLSAEFGRVQMLSSPVSILSEVETFRPDVVLLDMNFKTDINTGNEGLFWLGELKTRFPDLNVVLFTAYADISLAVEGMKRGAFDFIVKPWDNEKLLRVLTAASGTANARKSASAGACSEMYWGEGEKMQQLRRKVEKIAPTDATVLITGENGTGKDVLANEIHRLSLRSGKQMVSVDLGAVPESLFESELFGHVKGAFTDAKADNIGKFGQADGGTLFLDEIGNIPLHLQSKLLRVLQSRYVVRVGDNLPRPIDVRLVCATNMDLEEMVRTGKFREDLYYRINTVRLELPPLRERRDEIVPLAEIFRKRFSLKYGRSIDGFSVDAVAAMQDCRWNGNIRQLSNCIERAVILCEGHQIVSSDFEQELRKSADTVNDLSGEGNDMENETLEMAEERIIRASIRKYGGNLTLVAKSLDISRPTLYSKMKKYGI